MIERQFESETEDVILDRMKGRVDDNIDKRQGSVTHDMTAPASFEIAQVYQALDDVIALGLNVTEDSPDEFVDLKVKWSGVTRKAAIQSTGTFTIVDEEGTVIPVGTPARTDEVNPVYFHTTEEGVVTGGSVTVNAIADEGGTRGNVDANKIVVILGDLTGTATVTNTSPFTGGVDRETNTSLLERFYEKVRRPATSGNIFQYEQWAKSVPGVGDVKVKPVWNGPGTVKLILLDDQRTSPDPSVITATQTYVESVRPIGADVTYVGATELPINVTANLTLAPGADIVSVTNQFTEGLKAYLQSLAFVDNELTGQPELIRYTRIANVLLDLPPIIDYSNLLVNGGTSNIQPTDEQVGVVGSVTFT
ncbi:baseplate J/gp47 family protein [Psychrobacillus sp. FSL K6-1267]|uniref:baseplate J/gp47 family protein n=1 Tax=Psychrobacillus sp. FSL K6-1267 TaxID=2921543 RepID=UPI0030F87956